MENIQRICGASFLGNQLNVEEDFSSSNCNKENNIYAEYSFFLMFHSKYDNINNDNNICISIAPFPKDTKRCWLYHYHVRKSSK